MDSNSNIVGISEGVGFLHSFYGTLLSEVDEFDSSVVFARMENYLGVSPMLLFKVSCVKGRTFSFMERLLDNYCAECTEVSFSYSMEFIDDFSFYLFLFVNLTL